MNQKKLTLVGSRKFLLISSIFFLLLFAAAIVPILPPPGLNNPEPIGSYLNGIFPDNAPGGGSGNWQIENAYPNLIFTDPLAMIELPDQTGFYVAGKPGYLWKISKDPNTNTKDLVLDFSSRVDTDGDAGLINAILHPEFGQSGSPNRGYIYIIYRYHPDGNVGGCNTDAFTRLSRFTKPDGSDNFDPNSEFVMVQLFDTHCWHTGGGMFFDNDGYFYFIFGDAGGANDQFNTNQQIDQTLFGGLMRVDLESRSRNHVIRRQPIDPPDKPNNLPSSFTQGYYIPNDNPWQDVNGGILEEFYAHGFRSPHRATYDPVTEQIWVGDVGQGAREEISLVKKGGNYQWPYREGNINGPKAQPNPLIGTDEPPVFAYNRSVGNAVIGGFVYRGSKYASSLNGKYLFGDHGVRNIWTLNPDNGEVVFLANVPGFGVGSKNGISSFATDSDGEVYILKLYGTDQDGGIINKLTQDNFVADPPALLSQIGAFSNLNNLTPISGIVPYTVNTPLWSDGATKKRWIALPNDGSHNTSNEQITFSATGEWQFPAGTVFIKHFDLPVDENNPSTIKKVETRFIVITENGEAYGLTYKWNDAGTDAQLLTSGDSKAFTITRANGTQYTQTWEFPSRTDCGTCHNANANFVLGVKTHQLNGNFTYPSGTTDNQLNTWHHLGMFANPFDPAQIPSFLRAAPLNDNNASLEVRVRSYLDANCAHCHRPNGVEGVFDARFSTPLQSQNLINTLGISRNTPSGSLIVKPKDPSNSELWVRDNSLSGNAMPPLAKSIVDEEYMSVLTDWINSLEDPDCTTTYLTDLNWVGTPTNGWGPVEQDQSNGETGANDGATLSINGLTFARGLGVHANSEVIYNIGGLYQTFKAFIGVDDETCDAGSVQFEVYTDGTLAYQSPVLNQVDNALPIVVDVNGVSELKLVVNDGGSGGSNPIACDHADWADAKLEACTSSECTDLGIFAANEDIGAVQATGDACFENNTYTLTASGSDIWGTSDEFHFLHTNQTGEVEIIARVKSVENTNAWAKAGVMIRESAAPNAKFAMVMQRPDNQVTFQWRSGTGSGATWVGALAGGTSAVKFLRLTRVGNTFTAYYSTTGNTGPWTHIGSSANIAMNANTFVGLALTSHNDGVLCTAEFDNVVLNTCTTPQGTACNDGDPCTTGDVYDENCNCTGTFQDSDNDTICDANDVCPSGDDRIDSDNDNIPDACDNCDGNLVGTACNDNDPCTINDVYDANCNCNGTYQDNDNDGYCVSADPDDNDGCIPDENSTACDPCNVINANDFETGFGIWNDGGGDCTRVSTNANSGSYSIRLRDNSGTASSMYTDNLNLVGTSSVEISFSYITNSMDNSNEDFWLQVSTNGGSSYSTYEEWNLNDEFQNNIRYNEVVTITGINFTANTRFRFICDASANGDQVYIDDISIQTCGGLSCLPGSNCDDGDSCTVNDVYDSNCDCAGTFQDNDQDGVCAGNDLNDNNACIPDNNHPNCTPCNVIDENDFESTWGIWNDGGSDSQRNINDAAYANSGSYCIRLRDNSGTASSMFTDNLNLSGYNEIKISFSYITRSMDNSNEDFWLQVSTNGGSSYSTYEEWNLNDEFQNNVRYNETVTITGITFTTNTRFRFVCDASGNSDWVYIDDVRIEACSGAQNLQVIANESSTSTPGISLNKTTTTNQEKESSINQSIEYFDFTKLHVKVKPNPFNSELRLYIDQPLPEMKQAIIRILDTSGRIIYQRFDAPFDQEFVIPTHAGWTNGIYFIRVQVSDHIETIRIIKQ